MPMSFSHDNIGKPDCCRIPDKQLQEIDIKNNINSNIVMSSKIKMIFRIIGISLVVLAVLVFILLIFIL